MKQTKIQQRDSKMNLAISLLQQMTWNVPEDFAISIHKHEINFSGSDSAHGYIRLYPNNPKLIHDSAAIDILNMADVLHINAAIRLIDGAMFIQLSFHVWD